MKYCLVERGATIWTWPQDGAGIYVSGDASQMAKDVEATLVSLVRQRGRLKLGVAQDYQRSLAR